MRKGESKGTREGNFKGGILRMPLASIQYIHKPSHNAALAIDTLLLQMKNSELCVLFVRWMTLFYVMAIMAWVHMAWTRCIIGNPSEAG